MYGCLYRAFFAASPSAVQFLLPAAFPLPMGATTLPATRTFGFTRAATVPAFHRALRVPPSSPVTMLVRRVYYFLFAGGTLVTSRIYAHPAAFFAVRFRFFAPRRRIYVPVRWT